MCIYLEDAICEFEPFEDMNSVIFMINSRLLFKRMYSENGDNVCAVTLSLVVLVFSP